MNVRTAENLISCHREGVRPDASVQKALKMSESDELLREKLRLNAAFDSQIVEAVHFIKPPDSLRRKIAECSAPKALRKHAMHPTILCAIAGVLLAIGFGVYLEMERRAGFPGKENAERIVDQLGRMNVEELEIKSGTVGGLADWFMLHGFDDMTLPPDVTPLPVAGGRTFQSVGHTVAQVVIEKRGAVLHVFRAIDLGVEMEESGDWKFIDRGEWVASIRQRGGICTLLAFKGTVEEMKEFVHSLKP